MGDAIELAEKDFNGEINKEGVAVVDFWATWCGPCKQMGPVFEDLAKEYAGKVRFYKMNTEDCQEIPTKMGIRSIPNFIFFKNGKTIGQLVGFQKKELFREKLEEFLKGN